MDFPCLNPGDPLLLPGLEAAQAVLDALKQHLAPAPVRAAPAGGLGQLGGSLLYFFSGDFDLNF